MPAELAAFGVPALALLTLGGVLVGISKTSFGGIGAVSAALFALVMPAKESTAAVLLLLIVGDALGVALYGRHATWKLLIRLVPTVIVGLLVGAVFIRFVDDVVMRRTIGVLLLASVGIQLAQRLRGRPASAPPGEPRRAVAALTGVGAGFTTMTANAAGPIMALYLLAARVDKVRFIGTNAWFFALINLSKVPLTAGLGLFTPQVLWVALAMIPAVLVGAALGRLVIGRVTQAQFETVTIAASALSALMILVR